MLYRFKESDAIQILIFKLEKFGQSFVNQTHRNRKTLKYVFHTFRNIINFDEFLIINLFNTFKKIQ